jgi:ribonuclease T1
MERRALTRGGLAAVLVIAAVYVLLGGDLDLDDLTGNDTTTTSDTSTELPAPETTTEAPEEETTTQGIPQPPQGGGDISQQEAQEIARVLALVETGGPFPHDQDGTTFSNREGLLPQHPEGYYKEYTCETPGSDDRGARRLVIGSGGETYYTADHYESFTQIDPADYR